MTDTASVVLETVAARMRRDARKLKLTDRLDLLDLESLDVLEITFDLEQRFDIEIPYNANTALEFDTIGALVHAIERLIGKSRLDVNRVVVTGLGVVSPVGLSLAKYWEELVAGRSGFGPPLLAPADRVKTSIVAQVTDFVASDHFDARQTTFLDRVSQFAVVAARQAMEQSGLSFRNGLSEQTAVIVGTGVGGQTTADESFRRVYTEEGARFHPMTIPKAMASAPPSHISMLLGIRGPTFAIASACASATHAIGHAFQMIRSGTVTCAITGGTDAASLRGP